MRRQPGHLISGKAIANQDGAVQSQRPDDRRNVTRQSIERESAGSNRTPGAASCDSDDVKIPREVWSPVVERVGRLAELCEQDEREPRATPIQHLEGNRRIDLDEPTHVRGSIGPGRSRLRLRRTERRRRNEANRRNSEPNTTMHATSATTTMMAKKLSAECRFRNR
jgi:hypothetical protein